MKELSLHILNILKNSVNAEASLIFVSIDENESNDTYVIKISDNSKTNDNEVFNNGIYSSNTGLVGKVIPDISMLEQSAKQTGGSLRNNYEKGKGNIIEVTFGFSHTNRPILVNMPEIICELTNSYPNIDFVYNHTTSIDTFHFDTREVKFMLVDVPISNPGVQKYIRELIIENLRQIRASD
jgi:hypothetical protein